MENEYKKLDTVSIDTNVSYRVMNDKNIKPHIRVNVEYDTVNGVENICFNVSINNLTTMINDFVKIVTE